jgi:hypothetical protein
MAPDCSSPVCSLHTGPAAAHRRLACPVSDALLRHMQHGSAAVCFTTNKHDMESSTPFWPQCSTTLWGMTKPGHQEPVHALCVSCSTRAVMTARPQHAAVCSAPSPCDLCSHCITTSAHSCLRAGAAQRQCTAPASNERYRRAAPSARLQPVECHHRKGCCVWNMAACIDDMSYQATADIRTIIAVYPSVRAFKNTMGLVSKGRFQSCISRGVVRRVRKHSSGVLHRAGKRLLRETSGSFKASGSSYISFSLLSTVVRIKVSVRSATTHS